MEAFMFSRHRSRTQRQATAEAAKERRHDERQQRRAYHHGDLKRALVEAADAMIEEGGADELSLRVLAHAVGVSRMAAYNHFEDKEALLAEIVRLGFQALEQRLGETPAEPESPREALTRAAAAYLDLAAERPERFRLMFSRRQVDLKRHPNAANAAAQSYMALRRVVTQATGGEAAAQATLAAWSLVHGFASLKAELGDDFVDTAGAGITPAYMAAMVAEGAKTAAVFAPDPKEEAS
jgi:AcrR family transcriptional regulator